MTPPDQALAVHGGAPVRARPLPYARQAIDEADIESVVAALRSDWLTTGPGVGQFEEALARATGTTNAVAVSSGTAALHAAMHAIDVRPGDEVIVPAMTFAATANVILYRGATPVFADVERDTLLIDVGDVAARVTSRTKAIIAVDYAGQPCDYDALREVCDRRGLRVVSDACHSLGGAHRGRAVGGLADATAFSFHPAKHITTGEGGALTTDDPELAQRAREFRNHGITTEHRERAERGTFHYAMEELGFNYRLTDIQCALGQSQLRKLPQFVARRRAIASRYDADLTDLAAVEPLATRPGREHARHLYVVAFRLGDLGVDRDGVFQALRAEGIGANVHYLPVHLHPYYRRTLGTKEGLCPVAEREYQRIVSLPLFPGMTDSDADDVVAAVRKVVGAFRR